MATTSALISASSKLLTPTFLSSSRLSPSSSLLFRSRFSPINKPLHLTQSSNLTQICSFSFSASPTTATKTKTIAVGDNLPEATLSYFPVNSDELQTVTISELTKSKKTILFAVPGAFTPTCSQKHLPGFAQKAKELKSKGVDVIACISVNDAFVMKAWKEDLKISDEVMLLSDGNGDFTRAIGAELDLSDKPIGLGIRSRRYAMLVEDGVVKVLNLEEGGAFTNSSAEDMLKAL